MSAIVADTNAFILQNNPLQITRRYIFFLLQEDCSRSPNALYLRMGGVSGLYSFKRAISSGSNSTG